MLFYYFINNSSKHFKTPRFSCSVKETYEQLENSQCPVHNSESDHILFPLSWCTEPLAAATVPRRPLKVPELLHLTICKHGE